MPELPCFTTPTVAVIAVPLPFSHDWWKVTCTPLRKVWFSCKCRRAYRKVAPECADKETCFASLACPAADVGVQMVCPLLGVVQARPSDVSSGITHIRMSVASRTALLAGPFPQGQLARLAMMLCQWPCTCTRGVVCIKLPVITCWYYDSVQLGCATYSWRE